MFNGASRYGVYVPMNGIHKVLESLSEAQMSAVLSSQAIRKWLSAYHVPTLLTHVLSIIGDRVLNIRNDQGETWYNICYPNMHRLHTLAKHHNSIEVLSKVFEKLTNATDLSINSLDNEGNTPLHAAATKEVVALFLANHADISILNKKKQTVLMCNLQNCSTIDLNVYPESIRTTKDEHSNVYLHYLHYHLQLDLLTKDDEIFQNVNNQGETPIMCILKSKFECKRFVNKILAIYPKFWEMKVSPLQHVSTLDYLVSQQTPGLDWKHIFETVHEYDIEANKPCVLHLLFEAKRKETLGVEEWITLPAMKKMMNHIAIIGGKPMTPLMVLYRDKQSAISNWANLAANGAIGTAGWSLFSQLIIDQRLDQLVQLVEYFASVNIPFNELVPYFVKPQVWLNPLYCRIAFTIVQRCKEQFITLLASSGLFHQCIIQMEDIAVEQILEAHKNLDPIVWKQVGSIKDQNLNTCLHLLAQFWPAETSIVAPFCISNCEINAQNSSGDTALHIACRNSNHSLVTMLTHAEANIDITNNAKETPSTIAPSFFKKGKKRKVRNEDDDDEDFVPNKKKQKRKR